MRIREAGPDDAAGVLAIYAPLVSGTTVSFELQPPRLEEFRGRIESSRSRWAWLVGVDDSSAEGEMVVGYAYATAFRSRAAYRWSVETSVYVHDAHRGRGLGGRLYRELLAVLAAKGYCNAYAGVALPNEASVRLHKALGFEPVGVFRRAGWKFGSWHDVSWWQIPLRDGPPSE